MRRCGICRGSGHNRQTCPANTIQAVVQPAPQPSSDNTVQGSTRTASGRRKASCSYCRTKFYKVDRTHTCRTCPTRKSDLVAWIEENKVWARDHKKKMMELGMGQGAIVGYNDEQVFEIEGINFDDLSASSTAGYYGKMLGQENNYRYYARSRIYYMDEQFKVLSPIPAHMVAAQFPKDWENGTYGVPYRLRDTKSVRRAKKK